MRIAEFLGMPLALWNQYGIIMVNQSRRNRMDVKRNGLVFLALWVVLAGSAAADDPYAGARAALIEEIEANVQATASRIGRRELDERVMQVMADVPRHEFVRPAQRRLAYANRPLPISHGQTISQPYIVALMTDLLNVDETAKVLEIGAGSGYQAAVLARLVDHVHTIEIIEPLAVECRERIERLEIDNVTVHHGDGYYGLEDEAPFDAIMVTAAATYIPPPLVRQLKPGGRMVIPVGPQFHLQQLMIVDKDADGEITTRQVLPVRFVPLTGDR